jgi:hypothetical protein
MRRRRIGPGLLAAAILASGAACRRSPGEAATSYYQPAHHAPHGGTAIALGDDYHLELVRDPVAGRLTAYVLDDDMEDFVRVSAASVEVDVAGNGRIGPLVLRAVANPATGETLGDTAEFTAQADWLRTNADFEGRIKALDVHGTVFRDVQFHFPRGPASD